MTGSVNTKTHTDIKPDSWTAHLPRAFRPYALLARLDRPIGIWLLLLPGWWAIMLSAGGASSMNLRDSSIFALFALGAVIMRAAGCVINDLWDRKLDAKVERTRARPLASGEISTVLLGIISLPLIVLYPLMKRWTWWPQAFLGLTFNFGVLMGWAAVTGSVELPALLLYTGGVFWTLGYDTIYAHQDKEDDALAGIKSTALKFGAHSRRYVMFFYGAAWVLIALAALLVGGIILALLLIPAGAHLFMQLRIWQIDNPVSALSVFKSNRDCGLMVLAALALAGI
jgi:4-hydroxybenzoate polyprenyltransferase